MFKVLMKKRDELKKKNGGFTLMELIIVIAILGFLIAILLPRYNNYTDKAMGVAAAADCKNALTVATGHMLDNSTHIDQQKLTEQTGLSNTAVQGKTLVINDQTMTYGYIRGGITISATIDINNGTIAYTVTGDTAGTNRLNAVRAGLGIAEEKGNP